MQTTRIFRNGNSTAIRVPAHMAYPASVKEVEIERIGDEIRVRPILRPLPDELESFGPNPEEDASALSSRRERQPAR